MNIEIEKIKIPWYAPRGETEPEFIEDLVRSFKESGQWDPVLVRLNDDKEYELISGMQRLTAAKQLGWTEIDAKILDVNEEQAALLAVETNLVRKELKEIEEGKAIKEMMEHFELSQQEIASKLGKSQMWVSRRLALALDLAEPVKEMLQSKSLSQIQAVVIARLSKNRQVKFAESIILKQKEEKKSFDENRMYIELRKFKNNTLLTVGYEGQNINGFLKTLQKNKVELLLDVRESTKSLQKPEFAGKFLKDRLNENKIKYEHRQDLGAPYEVREAYNKGGLSQTCFTQWYTWHVTKRDKIDKLPELIEHIKTSGRTALLCYEKDVNTCHRNILANLIMEREAFETRRDLP